MMSRKTQLLYNIISCHNYLNMICSVCTTSPRKKLRDDLECGSGSDPDIPLANFLVQLLKLGGDGPLVAGVGGLAFLGRGPLSSCASLGDTAEPVRRSGRTCGAAE